MILVDRDIKKLVNENNLIVNYNEDRVNSISYDVIIDKFIVDDNENGNSEFILHSNKYVYVKTLESLNMPNNLCCMVYDKNSLMRKGLKVDGPFYQPGHKTCVFLRVINISNCDIVLNKGMRIAQFIFMKLNGVPDKDYSIQEGALYNNEDSFRR